MKREEKFKVEMEKMENHTEEGFCEIKVRGKLEPSWAEWFDSLNIEIEPHASTISGFVADQSALEGLMEKISMLGLNIISFKFRKIESKDGCLE